jgi:hypothetical protein
MGRARGGRDPGRAQQSEREGGREGGREGRREVERERERERGREGGREREGEGERETARARASKRERETESERERLRDHRLTGEGAHALLKLGARALERAQLLLARANRGPLGRDLRPDGPVGGQQAQYAPQLLLVRRKQPAHEGVREIDSEMVSEERGRQREREREKRAEREWVIGRKRARKTD